jgi:hypothetical protein
MHSRSFTLLLSAAALSHAALLPFKQESNNRLQRPLLEDSAPASEAIKQDVKHGLPLIDSEKLQSDISADALLASAEQLFKIAEYSLPEYNHPTRVIGSAGKFNSAF